MSPELKAKLTATISDALYEINEMLGYEYFEENKIKDVSKKFLNMLPFAEQLLMNTRGVTLKDLENEEINRERAKIAVIKGIFDGEVLKNYSGSFADYLYHSGTEQCKWISNTHYDDYFQALSNLALKVATELDKLLFIGDFTKRKIRSTTQMAAKISTKKRFFEDRKDYTESIIDEHTEIFRELGAIVENQLKLLYGIKHGYKGIGLAEKLEQKKFYNIWQDLKDDVNFKIFTIPFPNTVYWNASKHGGITKRIRQKELEFKSNEGEILLSYTEFITTVRELYACSIVLGKINLMIMHKVKT
jgi:hypothetical protein